MTTLLSKYESCTENLTCENCVKTEVHSKFVSIWHFKTYIPALCKCVRSLTAAGVEAKSLTATLPKAGRASRWFGTAWCSCSTSGYWVRRGNFIRTLFHMQHTLAADKCLPRLQPDTPQPSGPRNYMKLDDSAPHDLCLLCGRGSGNTVCPANTDCVIFICLRSIIFFGLIQVFKGAFIGLVLLVHLVGTRVNQSLTCFSFCAPVCCKFSKRSKCEVMWWMSG